MRLTCTSCMDVGFVTSETTLGASLGNFLKIYVNLLNNRILVSLSAMPVATRAIMMQSVGLCHETTGTCYTWDQRVVVAYFVIALIHCPEYVFLYFYTAYVELSRLADGEKRRVG